ncbi:MAG TPA: MarR family transcriptional regulator [Pseudonocardiaceae bacterium]|nr:MarR family transcriptional regulator [Pseudonocardiaceae bacterium]
MSQARENSLDQRPGYAVKRLQLAIRNSVDDDLASMRLSMAQFAALRVLADSGPVTAAELARQCFVTRQSMQDVLNSLRARYLVETVETASGGRTQKIAIMPAGKELMEQAIVKVEAVDRRMLRGLTPRQQVQFVSWLNTCAGNLTAAMDRHDDQ